MLFRPSFCANCGEKIERAEWGLWTSRRFCEVCETQFKGHDLIPRVIVGLGILAGLFGIGGFIKGGPATEAALSRQGSKVSGQQSIPPPTVAAAGGANNNLAANTAVPVREGNSANSIPRMLAGNRVTADSRQSSTDETMYFCGAATKKGTACSRRVRGNVRCYQHEGMPAMLPVEKLRAG